MPIGKHEDFDALKRSALARARRQGRQIRDPAAYAASVADRIEPGWRKEAAQKKRLRSAAWRRLSRRKRTP